MERSLLAAVVLFMHLDNILSVYFTGWEHQMRERARKSQMKFVIWSMHDNFPITELTHSYSAPMWAQLSNFNNRSNTYDHRREAIRMYGPCRNVAKKHIFRALWNVKWNLEVNFVFYLIGNERENWRHGLLQATHSQTQRNEKKYKLSLTYNDGGPWQ